MNLKTGETGDMKIGIICGSHRENGQSNKVAGYIQTMLNNEMGYNTWLYSLAGNPLPLWDEGVWDKTPEWEARLNPLREELLDCDGFVVISPEYHGQAPAGLKNFFLIFGRKELAHKPALIVTVSSGRGGAYPVAELRMSSYKNSRICYIPEHVIVREVESVLNDVPEENNERSDRFYRDRIHWALGMLAEYAVALKPMRARGRISHERYTTGM